MKHKHPSRTCGECIHQWACESWVVEMMNDAAAADYCTTYEKAFDVWQRLNKIFGKKESLKTEVLNEQIQC